MSAIPNVLIIGDSISMGYTPGVRRRLEGVAEVHRCDGNARFTGFGLDHLEEWLTAPGKELDIIHFNFGLHDIVPGNWGRSEPTGDDRQVLREEYEENLRLIVRRLKRACRCLVWATTTPVPPGNLTPPRRSGDEVEYNAIALRVMSEAEVDIDDLYAFALPILSSIQKAEDVHYTDEGYEVLAEAVSANILTQIRRLNPERTRSTHCNN